MTVVPVIDGKLTLSEEARKHLRLGAHDQLVLDLLPGGKVELAPVSVRSDLDGFIGSLYDPNIPALSIEEIKKLTEEAWAGAR